MPFCFPHRCRSRGNIRNARFIFRQLCHARESSVIVKGPGSLGDQSKTSDVATLCQERLRFRDRLAAVRRETFSYGAKRCDAHSRFSQQARTVRCRGDSPELAV